MYCTHCGMKLENNANYCPRCGANTRLSGDMPRQKAINKAPKRKKSTFLYIAAALIIVAVAAVILLLPKSNEDTAAAEELERQTIITTDVYYDAQIMTYKVLHTDPARVDYDTWYKGMEKACMLWQEVEQQSALLENACLKATGEEASGKAWDDAVEAVGSLFSVRTVYAYSQEEINAVFDAAPAGQRLKTLAGFLGTDAKTAYSVLKGTQEQIAKQAYEQADFYQKCETAATVIKDTAKVGFFAGSIALSGGTAATFGLLDGACVIAGGTDLYLEIYEDYATIAYGEGNDTAMVIKDLRKGTKPLAAILGLSNLAGNAIEQLGYLSDSTLALFQNDEVLGFNIKDKKELEKLKATGMDNKNLAEWAKANGINLDFQAQDLQLTTDDVRDVDVQTPQTPETETTPTDAAEPTPTIPAQTPPAETEPSTDEGDFDDFDATGIVLGTWISTDYWAGPMDENGHYTDYTADNRGYTYFLYFGADGSAVFDERNDTTGDIFEGVWVFQYTIDGTKIHLNQNGTLMYTFYYNPSDGIIYAADPETLTTNGTYRIFELIQ